MAEQQQKQKLVAIVGPTASGKSALGVNLARIFDGEVISADSRQVYRGLDIGTGKITKREMRGVPHHLLDVASPKKMFSAQEFVKKADVALAHIARKEKLPILVGGTGYFIDAFVGTIGIPDAPPHPALRKRLEKRSAHELYALLQKKDPIRAEKMSSPSERNNKRRLIRALEIVEAMGAVPSARIEPRFDMLWIGIAPPFAELEKKISLRLLARIKAGMIAEATRLHKGGLSYKRMEELGLEYRSLARYLQKKITKDEMIAELQRDIRRYAKKQLMYWKRNPNIIWYKPTETKKIEKEIRRWLKS